jgi:hypothetical protein
MTLEQMEAIASDLQRRVAILEDDLGGDAIALPANYYISPVTLKTVSMFPSSIIESKAAPVVWTIPEATPGSHKAIWEALSSTIASLEVEIQEPFQIVQTMALVKLVFGVSPNLWAELSLRIDGTPIETMIYQGHKVTTTIAANFTGGNAQYLYRLNPISPKEFGNEESGTFWGSQWVEEHDAPETAWKPEHSGISSIPLILPEGKNKIELVAKAMKTNNAIAFEVNSWTWSCPLLAIQL